MNWEMVSGLIRHLLTFGGGIMIAKGYTDEATSQTIVSGLVALIGAIWSVMAKKQ